MESSGQNTKIILPLPPKIQKDMDEEYRYATMQEQIKQELRTDPKYEAFFNQYRPASIDQFIDRYAHRKTIWIRNGESWLKYLEKLEVQWFEEAYEHLWQIQQKKLFNLQCQWRAEQLTLPDILISADFAYWGEEIRQCTLIPPISEAEVSAMRDFIVESSTDLRYDLSNWQEDNRETWKKPDIRKEARYPAWFAFFDERFGTGSLLELPNIRGKKERKYMKLYWDELDKKREEEKSNNPSPPQDLRPDMMEDHYETVEEFIRQFEDKTLLEYYIAYNRYNRDNVPWPYFKEHLEEILHSLLEIEEEIPVEAAETWQDALLRTEDRYHKEKIAEALPAVFADYKQHLTLEMPFSKPKYHSDLFACIREAHRKIILHGRELLGEPQDFNF